MKMTFQNGFYMLSTLGMIFSAGNVAKSMYEVFMIHNFETLFDIITYVLKWGNTFITEHFFTNVLSRFLYVNAFVTIPLWYLILDIPLVMQLFGTLFGMCSMTPMYIGNKIKKRQLLKTNISFSDFIFVEVNMVLISLCIFFEDSEMFIIIANWIVAVITPVVWSLMKTNQEVSYQNSKLYFVFAVLHASINEFICRSPVIDELLDHQTSLFDFTHSTFTIVMGTDSYILITCASLMIYYISTRIQLKMNYIYYILIIVFISTPLGFGMFVLDVWNFTKYF